MTLRDSPATQTTGVPHPVYDRVASHVNLPPTPNPEPADSEDAAKVSGVTTAHKTQTQTHLEWLTRHHRDLERSVGNKAGVVERDVPVVVSGDDLSLAELVAVAR